jgi:hypothetical protein
MEAVYTQFLLLYQLEMNRVNEVMDMFFFIRDTIEGKPINEVQEHIILDPFPEKEPPLELSSAENSNGEESFPKADLLYEYFVRTVSTAHEQMAGKVLFFS